MAGGNDVTFRLITQAVDTSKKKREKRKTKHISSAGACATATQLMHRRNERETNVHIATAGALVRRGANLCGRWERVSRLPCLCRINR